VLLGCWNIEPFLKLLRSARVTFVLVGFGAFGSDVSHRFLSAVMNNLFCFEIGFKFWADALRFILSLFADDKFISGSV